MIRFIRTFHNQLIIGETNQVSDKLVVTEPFSVMPSMEGLQLAPFDKELHGVNIDEITIPLNQLIYFIEPQKELISAYKNAKAQNNKTIQTKQTKQDIII